MSAGDVAIEQLYGDAVGLIRNYIGAPPPTALVNPGAWARNWAREHPSEAERLASELHNLLDSYFHGRGT